MVFWFWLVVAILAVPAVAYGLTLAALYLYVRWMYMGYLLRIFQERPLFVIPRGEVQKDAEDIAVKTDDGLTLRACYLKTSTRNARV